MGWDNISVFLPAGDDMQNASEGFAAVNFAVPRCGHLAGKDFPYMRIMITSKLTSKAQTTIPQPVRAALRLAEGDELAYEIGGGFDSFLRRLLSAALKILSALLQNGTATPIGRLTRPGLSQRRRSCTFSYRSWSIRPQSRSAL